MAKQTYIDGNLKIQWNRPACPTAIPAIRRNEILPSSLSSTCDLRSLVGTGVWVPPIGPPR
jgi:hypothetical protein